MPRLFVAIELPEDVRERLAGLCNGLPGARWVPPENQHLTLRFIGEVSDALAAGGEKEGQGQERGERADPGPHGHLLLRAATTGGVLDTVTLLDELRPPDAQPATRVGRNHFLAAGLVCYLLVLLVGSLGQRALSRTSA